MFLNKNVPTYINSENKCGFSQLYNLHTAILVSVGYVWFVWAAWADLATDVGVLKKNLFSLFYTVLSDR